MLKKLLILLLSALLIVFSVTACGSEAEETTAAASSDTSAAADTTTAEETTTETTTAATTAAPKEYEYTPVLNIDFSTMADGSDVPFTGVNNVENLRIEGGKLKGTINGGDPYMIYKEKLSIPAETVQEVHYKILTTSESYDTQLFFTTDTVGGFNEDASMKSDLSYSGADGDSNQENEVVFYTEDSADWMGTIVSFRLDLPSSEGDFEISSITFYTVTEKTAA